MKGPINSHIVSKLESKLNIIFQYLFSCMVFSFLQLYSFDSFSQWQYVGAKDGNTGLSPYANGIQLGFDSQDNLIVASSHYGFNPGTHVHKFLNGTFQNPNNTRIGDGGNLNSMAISSSGQVKLGYSAGGSNGADHYFGIFSYNGSSWDDSGPMKMSYLNPSVSFSPTGNTYIASTVWPSTLVNISGPNMNSNPKNCGFSTEITTGGRTTVLKARSDNELYLAFEDNSHAGKASVMKWNGSTWSCVGKQGFSNSWVGDGIHMDFNGSIPYIAYQEGNTGRATVMRFDGTNWVNVGPAGFTTGSATNISFKIFGGIPYISFSDGSYSGRVSVMKFNGTSWGYVGTAGFSTSKAGKTALAIDKFGSPWVAFVDESNNNSITVMTLCPALSQPTSISGNNAVCSASTQTYTVSPVVGASFYTWSLPNGWVGESNTNTITVTIPTDLSTTSATISVVANNSCKSSDAQSLNVTINNPPTQPSTITGATSVCPGQTRIYSVSTITGATSYSWQLPTGWTGQSTTTSITVQTGSIGGEISVAGNNSCGASSVQKISVAVTPIPTKPGIITGPVNVCNGNNVTYSVSPVVGATSYTWTLPSGWQGTSTNNSMTATASTNSGLIRVKANNTCGSSVENTLNIRVGVPDRPVSILGNASVCPGNTYTFSVNPVASASSYTWTLPSGWSGSSSTNTISVVAGDTGGDITVKANNACGSSSSAVLVVKLCTRESQIITFNSIDPKKFNDQDFNPGATASSGLPITYLSSNTAVANIVDNKIHITGVGTTSITASQPGNDSFFAANPVSQTLTVEKADQTITFSPILTKSAADADFPLGAAASSGLQISYTSSNPLVATVTDHTIAIIGVGTSIITAFQGGNEYYNAANSISQTLTVVKGNQTITFPPIADKSTNDPDFSLNAIASSGLSISYTSSNPAVATVSNSTVHIVGKGNTILTATQEGNENYNAATASQTLNVKEILSSGNFNNVTVTDNTIVNGNVSVTNLNLASGKIIIEPNSTLTLSGDFTRTNGVIESSNTSNLVINGNSSTFSELQFNPNANNLNNLTINRNTTLGNQLNIHGKLAITNGTFSTNDNLVLKSSAAGTSMVVNSGGVVNGQATVERYIDPAGNSGKGYRHYSSPVAATTISDLATTGYTPIVNTAYNVLPTPPASNFTTANYPNIFEYDESRLTSEYPGFGNGWKSPAATSATLTPGRGYTVNLPSTAKVDLKGTLNNGNITVNLTRGPAAESGWHLLGNPYPSPIDWDLLTLPANVNNAVYAYQSSGQYAGSYLSYVNGVGTLNNGILPMMQAFFVRATGPANFTFTNAARLTTYENPSFKRTTTEQRPLLNLQVKAADGKADDAFVYFEEGATAGADQRFDAFKVQENGSGQPTIYFPVSTEKLSINGIGPITADVLTLPLVVKISQTGAHTLEAKKLINFAAGTEVILEDKTTGILQDLALQPAYSFSSTTNDQNRFYLHFKKARTTGLSNLEHETQLLVYPNPVQGKELHISMSQLNSKGITATLNNALGQVVLQKQLAVKTGKVQEKLQTGALAKGIYMLYLTDGKAATTRKIVID